MSGSAQAARRPLWPCQQCGRASGTIRRRACPPSGRRPDGVSALSGEYRPWASPGDHVRERSLAGIHRGGCTLRPIHREQPAILTDRTRASLRDPLLQPEGAPSPSPTVSDPFLRPAAPLHRSHGGDHPHGNCPGCLRQLWRQRLDRDTRRMVVAGAGNPGKMGPGGAFGPFGRCLGSRGLR